ncbi:MAG: hypothetical protein Q9172_000614 [Xanthocarpia lactea]
MEVKADAEAGQITVSGDVGCYEVEDVEEVHPEPPNIQEITLAATGIIVHQYSVEYSRAYTKELKESLPGWELEFPASAIKNFVYSIRFQLVEQPKSSDCSRFVEHAGEDTDEEAGEEAGEDTGAAMELDPKAAEFPLATLNLQAGMEIRLAFEGGSTTRVTKGPYFWIWPMVIHILAGRPYNAAEKNQNQAELNAHAGPADLETPVGLSRPINTPRPRIPERGAVESFNLERPEKREYDNPEAKEAETQRLLEGYQVAYQRMKRTAEERSRLQRRLAAETKNADKWLDAFMECRRELREDAEADERAGKKRA